MGYATNSDRIGIAPAIVKLTKILCDVMETAMRHGEPEICLSYLDELIDGSKNSNVKAMSIGDQFFTCEEVELGVVGFLEWMLIVGQPRTASNEVS